MGKHVFEYPKVMFFPLGSSPDSQIPAPPAIKLQFLKFADDTFIGLISDGDESVNRWKVDHLVTWCKQNNQELNALKTVEMTVDFRKTPLDPITLCDSHVDTVEYFRFQGTTITQDLKCELNIRH